MKLGINILLGIAAGLAFLYMIGDNKKQPISKEHRISATIAFVTLILFIVAFNTFM